MIIVLSDARSSSRWVIGWFAVALNLCLPGICAAVEDEGEVVGRSAQELVSYLATVSKDLERLPPLPLNVKKLERFYLTGIAQGRSGQLVAVGSHGAVLGSAEGAQWKQIGVPLDVTLTAVQFAADGVGWLGGHEGTIMRLAMGAKKWEIVKTDPQSDGPILDFLFFDSKIGLALAGGGKILRTENGGADWHVLELFTEDYFNPHLFAGLMLGNKQAIVVGERGAIFKSDDQGISWTELAAPYVGSLFGVLQLKRGGIVAYGITGHAFYSGDVGESWVTLETGVSESFFAHVQAGESALLFGADGVAVRLSQDGEKRPTVQKLSRIGRFTVSDAVNIGGDRLLAATNRGIQEIAFGEGY